MSDIVKDFVKALKSEKKTSAYDTTAVVTRVEDDVAWVHIAGGVDETPVRLTINAKAGDNVQVRVSGGRAWLTGNMSAPPTDNEMAQRALDYGKIANDAAQKAVADSQIANEAASSAKRSADEAQRTAESVEGIARHAEEVAEGVEQIARDAETSAGEAKTAADTAVSTLSQVQEVLEVVEWVAKHGTYTKATTFNPNATYYTATATEVTEPSNADVDSHGVLIYYEEDGGIYVRTEDETVDDQKTYYRVTGTPVADPKEEHLSQYYTLAVTEAMADYIQSHLMLTNEGLYIVKDGSGYKLKLTDYGSYIVAPDGTTVVNQNTADGNTIRALNGTVIAHIGYGDTYDPSGLTNHPFYTLGNRRITIEPFDSTKSYRWGAMCIYNGYTYVCVSEQTTAGTWNRDDWKFYIGGYSHASGFYVQSCGFCSVADGYQVRALGDGSHAVGNGTFAIGESSHAEGKDTFAIGESSHAEGQYTRARGIASHAEGSDTVARGNYSHAQNYKTIAAKDNQTVIGRYNIEDTETNESRQKAFIIGNGYYDGTTVTNSNAFTVDWSGNVDASGEVTDGSGNVLSDKAGSNDVYTKAQTNNLLADKADTTDLADYLPLAGGTLTGTLNGTEMIASGNLQGENCKLELDTSATSGVDKEIYDALVDLGWDSDVIV